MDPEGVVDIEVIDRGVVDGATGSNEAWSKERWLT